MGLPEHFFDKTFIPLPEADPAAGLANQRTRVVHLRDLLGAGSDLEALHKLYTSALSSVYDYARGVNAPGIAYALLGPRGDVRTLQHIGDQRSRANNLVVGRHSHVDGPTDANNLALRHLVMTRRTEESNTVEVRDLKSAAGTRLLDGTRINAASIPTPMMLDLGELCLVVATTPLTLEKAAFIDRVLHPVVSEIAQTPCPLGLRLERFHRVKDGSRLLFKGPEMRLEEMREITPTPAQMTQGFMLGRYSRCDWPAKSDPHVNGLSRVHAIIFASQGMPYIVDTGSTNGVRHTELGCVRYKHLAFGDQFWLGSTCRLTIVEARDARFSA
jgi:FHA domain